MAQSAQLSLSHRDVRRQERRADIELLSELEPFIAGEVPSAATRVRSCDGFEGDGEGDPEMVTETFVAVIRCLPILDQQ